MDKKIVEFALDFEKKGTTVYLELASKVNNPLSKNLFYTLAKQEIEHAERIEKFSVGLPSEKIAEFVTAGQVEKDIKKCFEDMKNLSLPDENNLDVYKTAMELEKKGYDAYKKFYGESDNEDERKLLEFLLAEEKGHLDSIANVYSYLSGTSDWLEKEESKVWNWMNI